MSGSDEDYWSDTQPNTPRVENERHGDPDHNSFTATSLEYAVFGNRMRVSYPTVLDTAPALNAEHLVSERHPYGRLQNHLDRASHANTEPYKFPTRPAVSQIRRIVDEKAVEVLSDMGGAHELSLPELSQSQPPLHDQKKEQDRKFQLFKGSRGTKRSACMQDIEVGSTPSPPAWGWLKNSATETKKFIKKEEMEIPMSHIQVFANKREKLVQEEEAELFNGDQKCQESVERQSNTRWFIVRLPRRFRSPSTPLKTSA